MDLSAEMKEVKTPKRPTGRVRGAFFVMAAVVGARSVALGFFVSYVNEGRENPVLLSGSAVPLDSQSPQPWGMNGRLVGLSGVPEIDDPVGDNMYLLPGPYLEVRREVEVYSWHETNRGYVMRPDENGRDALQMTYEYDRRWSANPHNSLGFGIPEGHKNPGIHTEKGVYRPEELKVGSYVVPSKNLVMPHGQDLELTDEMLDLMNENLQEAYGRREGDFVYLGDANPNIPKIGDVRLHYEVVSGNQEVTFFGALSEGRLVPFDGMDRGAFRMELGGLDQSVYEANRKFVIDTWTVRGVSFAMVLVGMLLMISLPILKRRSASSVFLVLVLAFAWSVGAIVAYNMLGVVYAVAGATLLAWFSAFMIGRGQMRKLI